MSDNKSMNKLLSEAAEKYGVTKESLESAARSGNVDDLLRNTDSRSAKQLKDVLSNPEKAKKILQSPQARALLKLFGGE